MGSRRKELLWLLASLSVVALFFHAPLLGRAQFFHSDTHALLYPLKQFVAEEIASGRVPLWDPWSLNGTPVVASYVAAVFAPQTLLYLVLPFGPAFALCIVLKHLLGAVFEFLLLRRLGVSAPAAAVGGGVLALSGPFLSLSDFHAFAPECIPLVLWLWLRALDRSQEKAFSTREVLACIAGTSFAFLQGDLQCFFAAAVLGFVLPLFVLERPVRQWARAAGVWCLVLLGTVLRCAAQLFPSAALLPESTRVAMPREEWLLHSLTGAGLLETLWPKPVATAASVDFVALRYVGVVSVLLIVPALAFAVQGLRRRRCVVFGAAGGLFLALLLALGDHAPVLEPLASVLPLLKLFRYPEKWLLVATVGVATLAGFGVEALWSFGLRRSALVIGAAAVIDLFVVGSVFLQDRLVDPGVYGAIAAARPIATAPGFRSHDRVLRLPTNGPFSAQDNATRDDSVAWNIATLLGNNGSRAGVRQVGGLTSFNAGPMERFSAEAAQRERVPRLMDLLAAQWILTTPADAGSFRGRSDLRGLFGTEPPVAAWAAGAGTLELHRRPSALPRALVVPELFTAPDHATAVEVLLSERFDPRRAAVTVGAQGVAPRSTSASHGGDGEARFVEDGTDRLVIDAGSPAFAGGWLLVNDTFDSGWSATVNGVETPVVCANLVARAVHLPAGASRVAMRYRPFWFRLGLWTSGATALFLCALAWCGRIRVQSRPRSATPTPTPQT